MENRMEVPQKTKYHMSQQSQLLGIYPHKTFLEKDTCTHTFTAALVTKAKTWKQPKCPSTEEWIKMWYICTTEYYSAIKRQINAICSNMDGTRDSHTEWRESERESQIPCDSTSIRNLIYGTNEPFHRKETNSWGMKNRLVVAKGEGDRVGWTGSLRLVDLISCIWSG